MPNFASNESSLAISFLLISKPIDTPAVGAKQKPSSSSQLDTSIASPWALPAMNCNELQENVKPSCYVVKRPKALQWFHNGRLFKESEEERQAGRFELFLDLLCKS